MEKLEDQINKAAINYCKDFSHTPFWHKVNIATFENGAKSPEAKEYWFNTLIDETIENKTFLDFASKCASKKYDVGSKEHSIATISIKFGMGCSLTKEYWQQGMYSQDEVDTLFKRYNEFIAHHEPEEWLDWIEKNKKK